jgi:glycerophosphoryl diester phosphodiesterase
MTRKKGRTAGLLPGMAIPCRKWSNILAATAGNRLQWADQGDRRSHRLRLKVVMGWREEGMDFNYPQIDKLIDFGVDGIITDRPDILRGILVTRGLNLPNGFEIQ